MIHAWLLVAVVLGLAGGQAWAQDGTGALKDGWWQGTAQQRAAADVEIECARAETESLLRLARRLSDEKQPALALRCLDVALKYHPRDGDVARARIPVLKILGREREAEAEAAKWPAEVAAKAAHAHAEATPRAESAEGGPKAGPAHESEAADASANASADTSEAEPAGEAKAEPRVPTLRLGYLQASKDAEKVSDLQIGGSTSRDGTDADIILHLLKRTGEDAASDDFISPSFAHPWSEGTTSLLLGYSTDKGDVSLKALLGLRHVVTFAHERQLGVELAHASFAGGSDTDAKVFGKLPVTETVGVSGALVGAAGKVPGNAVTVAADYEHETLEGSLFLTSGKGIPPHAYLRPADTDAFRTIGADAAMELSQTLTAGLGCERRTSAGAAELEISVNTAWRF